MRPSKSECGGLVTLFFLMLTQKGLVNGNRLFVMQVFFLESFKSILPNDSICVAITSDGTMNSERAVPSVWIRLHNYGFEYAPSSTRGFAILTQVHDANCIIN